MLGQHSKVDPVAGLEGPTAQQDPEDGIWARFRLLQSVARGDHGADLVVGLASVRHQAFRVDLVANHPV